MKVTQSFLTLCDPMGYTVHRILQVRILEWVAFPFSKELNPGFPHCRWILYQMSHKGSPRILEWVAYPFSRGLSQPRNWTRVSCIAGRFFANWAIREARLWHPFYVDSKKKWCKWTYKDKETHRLREWAYGCWGKGIVREFGKVLHTLLYLKW